MTGRRSLLTFLNLFCLVVLVALAARSSSTVEALSARDEANQPGSAAPLQANATLTLSQGVDGYTGTTDTRIDSFSPTTNFGGATILAVRGGGQANTLIRFDLSPLPAGVTIIAAELQMTTLSRTNAASVDVGAFALRRPWAEMEATWQQAASGDAWGSPGAGNTSVDR
ncbi:MAG: DNRLRE domain-containing protein, partial [Caldilineales bacterium]|nr:DNRLRE domain-containing protein [Caldilineales bacterium]